MAIRVALNHKTAYRYHRLVTLQPQVIRLRPAPHCRTPIISYSLTVNPKPHFLNWQQDPYSNYLARVVFPKPVREFVVEVDLVADLTALNPFDFFVEDYACDYPFSYPSELGVELIPYLQTSEAGPRFQALLSQLGRGQELRDRQVLPAGPHTPLPLTPTPLSGGERGEKMRTIDFLVDVNQHLHRSIRYIIRLEPGIQSCEETLTLGQGSCRDSAWLLVQVLRHLGLAARFASGYLVQLTPDEKPLEGPPGPAKDFTDLHAWAEVYLPGAGWVGLDPTSGWLAGEGYIPLACSAHPLSAAPISGMFEWTNDPAENEVGDGKEDGQLLRELPLTPTPLPGGENLAPGVFTGGLEAGEPPVYSPGANNPGGEKDERKPDFHFSMSLTRVVEEPRVTKPYTAQQWQEIDALGHQIDDELRLADVRLTMGGEPTFVGIDDRDAAEWNLAALGAGKRWRAGMLLRRLQGRFAQGGLLHFGQGKWYPGESLPRWSLGCYWRRDGLSIWENPRLVAEDDRDYGLNAADSRRFIVALAQELRVAPAFAVPGYEDVWYYMWRERQLPVNVDPLISKLEDPQERERLARIFDRGLDRIVGYALPLRAGDGGPRWQSGRWFFRRQHMYLMPGDSPMGLRLPLDSLPWEAPEMRDAPYEPDPSIPRAPLPSRKRQQSIPSPDGPFSGLPWMEQRLADGALEPDSSPGAVIRTALCVEPRDGRMYVFVPPQDRLEDYLDLVAAIESTAAKLAIPVLIEGYAPPADHRLNHFRVTPDPGVLEVNIHPAHDWHELVENTNILYQEARQSRLSAEKFMLDGRHVGTGGGNHVIIGGPTPADSPILRRPDLLRSLLACWHNHPSLSYLFSGLFVGPTSQAPRVDEARNDSLYELEIASQQIPSLPGAGKGVAPWLVDRIFRHLLVDVTGNTHRAEFCIDKLYSPDTSGGRLGLVELRSFEMPPHPQMSLVQQLLLRALVARFWHAPYTLKLVRWGTELHDRFMLPHFVQQDFQDVLEEARQAGFALADTWFAPHFEFRFPRFGSVTQRGIQLELRQAIEPWHVLGEEPTGGGVARYVDTSVERLQVKVNGLTDTRHIVTCNGRRLPLQPTGVNGEFVAGVRYRAWQPPSCLHPTIAVHAPLVFDILDTWMGRSLGGCTYHVAHPGGTAYEVFPVNANEAEARRTSRFCPIGHTPGPISVPPEEVRPEAPLTLDLRTKSEVRSPMSDVPRGTVCDIGHQTVEIGHS